ncbi:MAG: phosphatidylglycerophosphatase A [Alphaproteobacteria bacterium]|nr:phosphatidylglycerophosphatase A [Alphaproteobacteria bacterium]
MSKKLAFLIATYGGLGLSPKAPGTVGSLGTLPLAFILCFFGGVYAVIIASVLIFVIGTPATHELIKNQQDKDPGMVVIDEVVGQLLTFLFVADNLLYQNAQNWWIYLFGFAAFRFFDICKMGPVKWFDRNVKNAYGVMCDDVCAGLMGGFCLWIGVRVYMQYVAQ